MKISIAGRKIILVVAILVIFFLIITQRRAASDQIADLQVRYEACKRHAESLATQLEVVNSHKKKMESMLADIKSEKDFTIKECELKLRTIREEDRMNKQKLLSCEQRVSLGNNPTGVLLSNITEIQLQNQRYVEEIARLKSQLLGNQGELKSQESRSSTPTTSVQHAENHQNLVLPEPNQVGQENYVGKNSVHFQRSHSVNQNLEFRRENDQVKLPEILSGKQLIKKLEEKNQKQAKTAEVVENEKVIDYRNHKEPDAREEDYKEIGH